MRRLVATSALMALLLGLTQVPATATASLASSQALSKPELKPMSLKRPTPQFDILTDYPGRQRTLTELQKSEIRAVLAKSEANTKFICTGIRLETNPQGMNLAVRLRAKLACEYAKSIRPDMSFWYRTTPTKAISYNGRVMVHSK